MVPAKGWGTQKVLPLHEFTVPLTVYPLILTETAIVGRALRFAELASLAVKVINAL
jgi:hypothetical protein